jgi:hypothetical protein
MGDSQAEPIEPRDLVLFDGNQHVGGQVGPVDDPRDDAIEMNRAIRFDDRSGGSHQRIGLVDRQILVELVEDQQQTEFGFSRSSGPGALEHDIELFVIRPQGRSRRHRVDLRHAGGGQDIFEVGVLPVAEIDDDDLVAGVVFFIVGRSDGLAAERRQHTGAQQRGLADAGRPVDDGQ